MAIASCQHIDPLNRGRWLARRFDNELALRGRRRRHVGVRLRAVRLSFKHEQ